MTYEPSQVFATSGGRLRQRRGSGGGRRRRSFGPHSPPPPPVPSIAREPAPLTPAGLGESRQRGRPNHPMGWGQNSLRKPVDHLPLGPVFGIGSGADDIGSRYGRMYCQGDRRRAADNWRHDCRCGLASGLAEAQPAFGPFVAPFPAGGPWTWCPGQDMTGLHTDTGRGGPGPLVQWDMSQCHTWYYVNWGYGNVTSECVGRTQPSGGGRPRSGSARRSPSCAPRRLTVRCPQRLPWRPPRT